MHLSWITAFIGWTTVAVSTPFPDLNLKRAPKCASKGLVATIKAPTNTASASAFCSSFIQKTKTIRSTTTVVGSTKTVKSKLPPATSTSTSTALATQKTTICTSTATDSVNGPYVATTTIIETRTRDGHATVYKKEKRADLVTPSYFSGVGVSTIISACSCLITTAPTTTTTSTITRSTPTTVTSTTGTTKIIPKTVSGTTTVTVNNVCTTTPGRTFTAYTAVDITIITDATSSPATSAPPATSTDAGSPTTTETPPEPSSTLPSDPEDPNCHPNGFVNLVQNNVFDTTDNSTFPPWIFDTYGGTQCQFLQAPGYDIWNALDVTCTPPDDNSYSVVTVAQDFNNLCVGQTYRFQADVGADNFGNPTPNPVNPNTGFSVLIYDQDVVPYTQVCPGGSCPDPGKRNGWSSYSGSFTAKDTYARMWFNFYLWPTETNAMQILLPYLYVDGGTAT